MHKMKEPKYVAATLKWCNERRKERGKKPLKRMPKGRRHDPWSCPCGKTANMAVGAIAWRFDGYRQDKPLPASVKRFVLAFDDGKLPQYELCTK